MSLPNQVSSPELNLPKNESSPENETALSPEEERQKETAPEQVAETAGIGFTAAAGGAASPSLADSASAPAAAPLEKTAELIQIEEILSAGLENLYAGLPDNRKKEFKIKGEETARSIEKLLDAAKVHVNKIVSLIIGWLKMIPGVNKFFLEQDSKIKTDKLMEYKKSKM